MSNLYKDISFERNLLSDTQRIPITEDYRKIYTYIAQVRNIEPDETEFIIPEFSDKDLKNYSFPLPPIEKQEKIIKILDKFEALVNDITIGLPAEIEVRRKQYEYYRNKLLTFEEYANE